jgi:hypothetical protein
VSAARKVLRVSGTLLPMGFVMQSALGWFGYHYAAGAGQLWQTQEAAEDFVRGHERRADTFGFDFDDEPAL